MKPEEAAQHVGVSVDDLRTLVRAADVALQEYGSDDQARAARRAAEALGFEFRNDHGLHEHQHDAPYRLHFDPDAPPADPPSVDELSGGTPLSAFGPGKFESPSVRGFIVVAAERRLTVAEWILVTILRRPDPRREVYPMEVHAPGASGPDTQTFTVSLK